MKARRFDDVLRYRGYKCRERSEYQGVNIYEKEHLYNKVVCTVVKDSHGKAQSMTFNIYNQINRIPKDMVEFKEAEFDRSYLVKEAQAIHEAFEKLREMKGPKHLYCF